MSRAILSVSLSAVVCCVSACGGGGESPVTRTPEATAAARLPDGRYVADRVDGRELVPGTELELGFGGSQYGASAGCNDLAGEHRLEDRRIRSDDGFVTQIGCGREVVAQERWYFRWLDRARATEVADGLLLQGDGVTVHFRSK